MNNRPDFFIAHQNRTNGKKSPCYKCTNRSENCHANCEAYNNWKTPPGSVEELYYKVYSNKRSLQKINGGR